MATADSTGGYYTMNGVDCDTYTLNTAGSITTTGTNYGTTVTWNQPADTSIKIGQIIPVINEPTPEPVGIDAAVDRAVEELLNLK